MRIEGEGMWPSRSTQEERTMRGTLRLWAAVAVAAAALIAAGCGGGGGSKSSSSGGTPAAGAGSKGGTINVAIVDNPQMKDIAALTPSLFTAKTGIKVKYTVLDEGTLREVTTRDVAAGGRGVDVGVVGNDRGAHVRDGGGAAR